MTYGESLKALYAKAAETESMEGTVKYEYTASPDDAAEYRNSSARNFIAVMVLLLAGSVVVIVLGAVFDKGLLLGSGVGILIVSAVPFAVYIAAFVKAKKRSSAFDEVTLSFNVYGVVMRMSSALDCAVFVYAWNDFDSLIEYKKVVAGVKNGLALIFPKRVFSQEEFEAFRRFSYAGAGKKCVYKNFNKI